MEDPYRIKKLFDTDRSYKRKEKHTVTMLCDRRGIAGFNLIKVKD